MILKLHFPEEREERGPAPGAPAGTWTQDACPTTSGLLILWYLAFTSASSPSNSCGYISLATYWCLRSPPMRLSFFWPYSLQRVAHFLLSEIQRQKHFPLKRQGKIFPGHQIVVIETANFLRRKSQACLSFNQGGLLYGFLFIPCRVIYIETRTHF